MLTIFADNSQEIGFFLPWIGFVPDRFIAALGGMKPRGLMEANDFERAPVEVSFAPSIISEPVPQSA